MAENKRGRIGGGWPKIRGAENLRGRKLKGVRYPTPILHLDVPQGLLKGKKRILLSVPFFRHVGGFT